jgi:hypothetical protein
MYQIIIKHRQNNTAQVLEYVKLGQCLNSFREICDSKGYEYEWEGDFPTAGGIGHDYDIEVYLNF